MNERTVNVVGPIAILVGFVLGLAVAGMLYAWETGQRSAAPAQASSGGGAAAPAVAPTSASTAVAVAAPSPSPAGSPAAAASQSPAVQPANSPVASPPAAASPAPAGTAPTTAGDPVAGKQVFETVGCNGCHPNGKRGAGPDISGPAFNARFPNNDFIVRTVRSGRGIMPAFGPNQLSDAQLADVIAYLRSLP